MPYYIRIAARAHSMVYKAEFSEQVPTWESRVHGVLFTTPHALGFAGGFELTQNGFKHLTARDISSPSSASQLKQCRMDLTFPS